MQQIRANTPLSRTFDKLEPGTDSLLDIFILVLQ